MMKKTLTILLAFLLTGAVMAERRIVKNTSSQIKIELKDLSCQLEMKWTGYIDQYVTRCNFTGAIASTLFDHKKFTPSRRVFSTAQLEDQLDDQGFLTVTVNNNITISGEFITETMSLDIPNVMNLHSYKSGTLKENLFSNIFN
jgi:hypothetical protein